MSGPGSAEQLLLDGALRALRSPGNRLALVLHLSRIGRFLGRSGLQPHHRRIARALLTEAAQRYDGQLFALGSGDIVLLCRHAESPVPGATADDPASLGAKFSRLFGAEVSRSDAIVSLWPLASQGELLLAYAEQECAAAEASRQARPDDPAEQALLSPVLLPPIALATEAAPVTPLPGLPALLQRRTGALIARPGATDRHSFRPLFREIAFSPAALWARYGPAPDLSPDPWLLRHFAQRLEEPMLALIEAALPGGGPIGMAGTSREFALHLNLSANTINKERCEHLIRLCRSMGVPIAIEVSLSEAAAIPDAFAAARRTLHRSGGRIVLGEISCQALLLIRAQSLDADLFKLEWSPRLSRLSGSEQDRLTEALAAIGPERLILSRADSEDAMLWGIDRGIRRFVGPHVAVMLAARRMLTCAAAADCTLGQCTERAASAAAPGRRFCRNLALLDSAAPA